MRRISWTYEKEFAESKQKNCHLINSERANGEREHSVVKPRVGKDSPEVFEDESTSFWQHYIGKGSTGADPPPQLPCSALAARRFMYKEIERRCFERGANMDKNESLTTTAMPAAAPAAQGTKKSTMRRTSTATTAPLLREGPTHKANTNPRTTKWNRMNKMRTICSSLRVSLLCSSHKSSREA